MAKIALTYEGSRLVGIGQVALTYRGFPRRPRTLGRLELSYDMLGSRLCAIGGYGVDYYDLLGFQPRTVGSWQVDYGRDGARMTQIGPYLLTYRALGSRVAAIGPMILQYRRLGRRPRTVELPDGAVELTEEQTVMLFIVLYSWERTRIWRSGGG